jgi:CBS domain containing-hemolysin-like protein
MLLLVLVVLSLLVVSFMCSVSEAVVLSVTHAQVEALGRSRAAEILREFKREIDRPIVAIVAFNTVAHTAGASVCGALYVSAFGEHTLWIFVVGGPGRVPRARASGRPQTHSMAHRLVRALAAR